MKIPLSQRATLDRNLKLVIGRGKSGLRRKRPPPIPSAANWGWGHLPASAKILIVGVFCGLVSITTPFWASVRTEFSGTATYGLWHFCRDDDCTSIRDNILEGSSVPAWHTLVQGSMCIGVACSLVGMAIVTNSMEGKILSMTVTVHRTCACVLGISAVEHFLGLYVFLTYLEETDFLFDRQAVGYVLDLHGSFYAGIISFSCSLLAALVVYLDDSICRVHKDEALDEDMKMFAQMLPEEMLMYAPYYEWDVIEDDDGYNNDGCTDDVDDEGWRESANVSWSVCT